MHERQDALPISQLPHPAVDKHASIKMHNHIVIIHFYIALFSYKARFNFCQGPGHGLGEAGRGISILPFCISRESWPGPSAELGRSGMQTLLNI